MTRRRPLSLFIFLDVRQVTFPDLRLTLCSSELRWRAASKAEISKVNLLIIEAALFAVTLSSLAAA